MFCSNCGKEVTNPGEYCAHCGAPLKRKPCSKPDEAEQDFEDAVGEEPAREEPMGEKVAGEVSALKKEKPEGSRGTFASALKITALVIAVLYVISRLSDIVGVLASVFSVIGGYPLYGILYFAAGVLQTIAHVAMAGSLALFGLCRDDERNNTEPLLLTVVSAGILSVLLSAAAPVLRGAALYVRFGHFSCDMGTAGYALLGAAAAVGILTGLTFLAGLRPFAGKGQEELMEEIKALPDTLGDEIERFRAEHQKAQSPAGNRTEKPAEGAPGGPAPASQPGLRRMKENRGLLKFIFIGAITCGVYMLYTLHMLAKDINEMCEGDGENTAGLLKLILFTLITCTVYNYIWHYKLMNRIQNNAERYGIKVRTVGSMDLGACWVVLSVAGLLISWCGIGLILSLYADYLMFQNMNLLSKAYNAQVVDAHQA